MKKYLAIALSFVLTFSSCISIFAMENINTNLPINNVVQNKDNIINVDGINYTITQKPTETILGKITLSNNQTTNLKEINVPASVNYKGQIYYITSIEQNAFFGNPYLEKATISNQISLIGDFAFANCQNLKEINITAGRGSYKSENGILLNYAKDTLITYPAGKIDKTYILPASIKKIYKGAFYNVRFLERLNSSTFLEEIGDYAFADSKSIKEIAGIIRLKTVGNYAFANSNLETIFLSTYVETLGIGSFYNTKISSIEIPYRVTSIPEYAFYNCNNLKTVKLPDDLKTIGRFAFANSNVDTISFPKYVHTVDYQAFANCKNLKSVVFNEDLKYIKEEAFLNCTGLKELNFKRELLSIDKNAFTNCSNIEKVSAISKNFTVDNNILYKGDKQDLVYFPPKASFNTLGLPVQTKTISQDAILNMDTITAFNVPAKNEHFSSLDGVLYNKNKTTLVKYPVQKQVSDFFIPSSVKEIAPYGFANATKINGFINIEQNLEKIGEKAFYNMPNFSGFNVYEQNNKFSSRAGILYDKNKTNLIKYPSSQKSNTFELLFSVKNISDYAFQDADINTFITNVNLETIGKSAFLNSKIQEINLKDGLKEIKEYAFSNTSIKNLILPNSIITIGNNAFENCKNLKMVEFKPLEIKNFGHNMFAGSNYIEQIIVPINTYNTYKNYLISSGVSNLSTVLKEIAPPTQTKK